jgi:hypothetical protein
MQQLTIEHKKSITNNNQKQQVVSNEIKKKKTKDIRSRKGLVLALSRRFYRLENSDTFYVESESTDNEYYFGKYNPPAFEWCACPDNSTRHIKCKHLYAIEIAIRFGTLKAIDKLPLEAKIYGATTTIAVSKSSSYEEDEYSF